MGGRPSFVAEPTVELFRVYFSSLTSDQPSELDLRIDAKTHLPGVSELVYTLQFIDADHEVVDEVSVRIRYDPTVEQTMVRFEQHLLSNITDSGDYLHRLRHQRIGFPTDPVIFEPSGIIRFQRIDEQRFLLEAIDLGYRSIGQFRHHRTLGILEFRRSPPPPIRIGSMVRLSIFARADFRPPMSMYLHPPCYDRETKQYRLNRVGYRYSVDNELQTGHLDIDRSSCRLPSWSVDPGYTIDLETIHDSPVRFYRLHSIKKSTIKQ